MRRRRAILTDQQRETILQQRRNLIRQPRRDGCHSENASITEDPAEEGQHPCQQTRRLPRFDDPEVIAKMTQFHDELAGLQLQKCSICLERFPNISINNNHNCKRCDNDNSIPKLFSAGNNMDPGSIPLELTVSIVPCMYIHKYDWLSYLYDCYLCCVCF